MNPRFVILVLVALALAALAAVKFSNPAQPATTTEPGETMTDADRRDLEELQKMLGVRDLPGEEPPEPSDLSIQVEVNQTSGKNRLDFWISEAHGFYVESFNIEFWYKEEPDVEPEDASLRFVHIFDRYVPANETVKGCIEVVWAELSHVGGDIGATENWGAQIISHGRSRMKNPDPLPLLSDAGGCD
ncbi:MAG: hypothetical protein IIB60_02410 [Planctomycetes bacterium]|nr:hypothetical protein [Planctomycetota bacterium]MCH8966627.1 hypothetical protein [Planctomycetota bacterium]